MSSQKSVLNPLSPASRLTIWRKFTPRFPQEKKCYLSPRGFTLIELIAVVATLAILAAIILPVINSSLTNSRQAKGSSNLRQIYNLFQLYALEHDNEILPGHQAAGQNAETGPYTTRRPGELDNFALTLNMLYTDNIRGKEFIFHCPADTRFEDGDYNNWMANHGSYRMATWPSWNWQAQQRNRWHYERFANLSLCIFLFDSDGGGHGSGISLVDFRHAGKANVLFMDGSVRSLEREDFPQSQTEGIWQGRRD